MANCQDVVTASSIADEPTSTLFHWPVNAQLYLPETCVTDQEGRERTHVPPDTAMHTKPERALQLIGSALMLRLCR